MADFLFDNIDQKIKFLLLQTKWLWIRVPLWSNKFQKSRLDIRATTTCRFLQAY